MSAGNNRKENTFRKKQEEPDITEEVPLIEEGKTKKESPKTSEKPSKGKSTKAKEQKKETKPTDGRVKRIIGILFICLALFLGIALISYLVSFFSGHHQEYGFRIFEKAIEIKNRTGRAGVFFGQTLIKESFGIGAFFFVYLATIIGLWLTDNSRIKMWSIWKYALMSLVWLPLFFAFSMNAYERELVLRPIKRLQKKV